MTNTQHAESNKSFSEDSKQHTENVFQASFHLRVIKINQSKITKSEDIVDGVNINYLHMSSRMTQKMKNKSDINQNPF